MDTQAYNQLLKTLYLPSAKSPSILEIPAMRFAMIDGSGDPNTSKEFEEAVGALYSVSYGIKMLPKKGAAPPGYFEYKVSALEGLWDMAEGKAFTSANKSDFVWTLMIMQPDFVTEALFSEIKDQQIKKKGNPAIERIRYEEFAEGLCCQMMHIGPFDAEPATFSKMQYYTEANGYRRLEKRHHEIYLSDFRRTAPEKLKTVLRFRIIKV